MAFSCVLHFVTSQFPAILMLEEEMGDVRTAAKVSLQELEKDVKTFKTELKDVEKVNYKFLVYRWPTGVRHFSKSSIWSDFTPNSDESTAFLKHTDRILFLAGFNEFSKSGI